MTNVSNCGLSELPRSVLDKADEGECFIPSPFHKKISHDPVNHPSHYTAGKKEAIDLIYESMTHEQFVGYIQGNVLKYMMRYRLKNGIEDLRKAIWYLEYLVKKEAELNSKGISS